MLVPLQRVKMIKDKRIMCICDQILSINSFKSQVIANSRWEGAHNTKILKYEIASSFFSSSFHWQDRTIHKKKKKQKKS